MMRSILMTVLGVLLCNVATGYTQKLDEYHLDETYAIAPGGTVYLKSNDADVFIIGSERSDVRVKVDYRLQVRGLTIGDSDKFHMDVRSSSNRLEIRERVISVTGFIGNMKEDYKIRLEVPNDVNLEIDGDDDDYDIQGVHGNLELKAEDGFIQIRNSRMEISKLYVDDADIEIDGGQGKLRIRGEDGDTVIRNGAYQAIDLKVDDGDVELETQLAQLGKYQLEGADGDFDLTFLGGGGDIWIKHDAGSLVTNGSFEIQEHNEHNKRLRLYGGDAKVRIKLDDGDVTLNTIE
ncbi:MAG: DUF4097 family beta strand repeat-containing protein [Bacteroidota bacterium]